MPVDIKGSLGSAFRSIRAPPTAISELATRVDWNRLGRRVLIDPATGSIAWMAPSSPHAIYADAADEIAKRAGALAGKRVRALRDTRWKQRPEHPDNTGMEPDACFYVGPSAEGWYAANDRSLEAALAYESATPPDLVVEIEWTSIDDGKPLRYAELGTRELWHVERLGDGVAVEILDLQVAGGPEAVADSPNFPGIGATCLQELLGLARRGRLAELERRLTELLANRELD